MLGIALTLGLLLTGISTFQAGVLPRPAAVLLLAATAGFFFVFFVAEFLPAPAGLPSAQRALRAPRPATVPTALGLGLVGVCALDVVAGVWLRRGRQRGANLGLAMTLTALAFGAGFALPFLLAGVPIRVALVLAGRRTLR